MRKTQVAGLAAALVAALTLQGCIVVADGDGSYSYSSDDWQKQERENRKVIASLDEGATINYIENRLGTPNFSELWTVDGDKYRVLYYRTHRVDSDGETSKDECTPLVFVNGSLVGTGELAVSRIPAKN
ncbi:hypothetical protein CWE22_10140 [Pseudidiomarina aestuarii]|uniref:DUF3192 domain-containing protein n=1 Tax=Pseudidiomarina aestuarii TaxID=624146 RepID=A0A7Z6ZRZ8_9GAMM|nr:DUF3192 domain-containing protein [Pseudidiomarina aestuarii]RUO39113.1 hypothetical protein CWE22_10140 [Pseudidiomarina aestuarii]